MKFDRAGQFGQGAYTGPRIFDLDGFDGSIPKCFNELFISGFEVGE
jgi:hypothetical protein